MLKPKTTYISKHKDYIDNRINEIISDKDFQDGKIDSHDIIFSLIYNNENDNLKSNIYIKNKISKLKNILSRWTVEKDGDALGYIYQQLESFSSKKKKGQYFTPDEIVNYIVEKSIPENIDPLKLKILDPACGSGQFLIAAFKRLLVIYSKHGYSMQDAYPHIINNNLFGFDIDTTALEIAKFNLKKISGLNNINLNIYETNFLLKDDLVLDSKKHLQKKYDIIIGNPPWGSKLSANEKKYFKANYEAAKSGVNTFSLFIERSFDLLVENGKLGFLIPEAFLNIKAHRNIRLKTLDETLVSEITTWGDQFKKVYAPCISIILEKEFNQNKKDSNTIKIYGADDRRNNTVSLIPQNYYYKTFENIFNIKFSQKSVDIIDKISHQDSLSLKENAKFFLGIVTGNNSKFIQQQESEITPDKILMGKDVTSYQVNFSGNYFKYDSNNLQQVAPQNLYTAKDKILYKFIGKKLTFALDREGYYTLNNINGFIPDMNNYSPDVLVALLNSKVMQYFYEKNFFTLKVLRGNLEKLPIKKLNKNSISYLDSLSKMASRSSSNRELKSYTDQIDDIVFYEYGIKDKDASIIWDSQSKTDQLSFPGM